MKSIYTELALYGSKNECTRTDNVQYEGHIPYLRSAMVWCPLVVIVVVISTRMEA